MQLYKSNPEIWNQGKCAYLYITTGLTFIRHFISPFHKILYKSPKGYLHSFTRWRTQVGVHFGCVQDKLGVRLGFFCLDLVCVVQCLSTWGESFPLKSSLLTLLLDNQTAALLFHNVKWKPPDPTWRPQLHILWVGGVWMVAMGHLRRLLGVILRGVATIIGVLLFLLLLSFVVGHCCRVVWWSVGLVPTMRQRLYWFGGNIWSVVQMCYYSSLTSFESSHLVWRSIESVYAGAHHAPDNNSL